MLGVRARRLLHQARTAFLGFEHDGAGGVDDQFQKGDVDRCQDQRQPEEQRQDGQADDRDVYGQRVHHGLAQVGEDAASQTDGGNNRAEVVFEQHQRSRLAGNVGAALAHGDADVRGLQRGCIVHAVAGHGDHFAVGLERFDNGELLLRRDAGERRSTERDALRQCRRVHVQPVRRR